MRIAVAGSGRLGTSVLEPLLDSEHEVVAVILDGRTTRGLKRSLKSALGGYSPNAHNLIRMAKRNGIPQFWIDTMSPQELAPLKALNVDLILVSGFSIILKLPLLELPSVGCVNMHSSLLPMHRGPNPFHAVIRDGEAQSGITFHAMETGIDTGAILKQVVFDVPPRESVYGLYCQCCTAAAAHVVDVMDNIAASGRIEGTPQHESLSSYDKKPQDADAWIDWREDAENIERKIRAFASQPLARFRFQRKTVLVLKADYDLTPVEEASGTVLALKPVPKIATGAGTITLEQAAQQRPFMWVWPHTWSTPIVGEQLPLDQGGD